MAGKTNPSSSGNRGVKKDGQAGCPGPEVESMEVEESEGLDIKKVERFTQAKEKKERLENRIKYLSWRNACQEVSG